MNGFEGYRKSILKERISAAVVLMAVPLYLSFSVIDYLCVREEWLLFLCIRVSTCILLAVLAGWMSKREISINALIYFGHAVTLMLGAGIGFMTFVTGGFESPYYGGLNWISIGSLAFWPNTMRHRVISLLTIYVPLIVMVIVLGNSNFSSLSILSITFMLGTCGLSALCSELSIRSLKREHDLREKLQEHLRDKDKIIEVKSNEAANFKRLAKQFSPTVIQAIESKTITLDSRARKKIAVIFIDVVGSADRASHLDYGDYQKVLDQFFDMCIKKLLSRNVTVANFMGDGLMAIANAPFPTENFERMAFQTAVEIVKETHRRQRSFRELCIDEFHIRIGISSGFSTVGFFPNTDFGVYTAIGESVNLAARLCDVADESSIATTKQIILAAGDAVNLCNVKASDFISNLKGFEGNEIQYFVASPHAEISQLRYDGYCPLCGNALTRLSDLGDCILVRCQNCQYSDIVDKKGNVGESAA